MEGGCEGADAGERRVVMAGGQADRQDRSGAWWGSLERGRDGKDWEGCERRGMGG